MRVVVTILSSVLLIILFSCNKKKQPENYYFVEGVVLQVENIHTGWGYYKQHVLYEFQFNKKTYQQIENTGRAQIYHLKYHQEDSVLIQIPDGDTDEAQLVRVTKRSTFHF